MAERDVVELLLEKLMDSVRESERGKIAGELSRSFSSTGVVTMQQVLSIVLGKDIET